MTREEAKRILYVYRAVNLVDVSHREAFDMAITELEQEPCVDAISRQAAIDAIWDGVNMDIYTREVKECLEQLPPVTPAEKQEPCDNCIRREDALMALTGEYMESPIEILPKAIKRINALPPVTPVEKVEL